MSALLMIVLITWGILFFAFLPAFLIWKHWFHKDPFDKNPISRWAGFRRKTPDEIQLEAAKQLLSQGSHGTAENEYRAILERVPESVEARLGLAESLFEQAIKGTRKDPAKKTEALEQYKWAIDYFNKRGDDFKTLALYKKLLGPYSESDLGITSKPLK